MLRYSRPPLTRRTSAVRPEVALTAFTASSFDSFLLHRHSRRFAPESSEPKPAGGAPRNER